MNRAEQVLRRPSDVHICLLPCPSALRKGGADTRGRAAYQNSGAGRANSTATSVLKKVEAPNRATRHG